MSHSHIFLSHAVADKVLADRLTELIRLGCDVPVPRIFCSSLEGMGIPAGTSFPDFIQEKIQNPALVIALITPSYLASEFCLCELGATWAMSHNFFPLIVKPADRGKVKGVLTGVQIEKVDDDCGLDNLRDRIKESLGCSVATSLWNTKRDSFLENIKPVLAELKLPHTVDRSELESAQSNYSAAIKEAAAKDGEIAKLSEIIGRLKVCKDAEEFSAVIADYSNEAEQFSNLVGSVKDAFQPLPRAVEEALFQREHGRGLICVGRDSHVDRADAEAAAERAFLYDPHTGHFPLRDDHPKVAQAISAIDQVRDFLQFATDDFKTSLRKEHGFPVELSNRDFWNAIF